MSEDAAKIAREANGLQQNLKELIKDKDIWDREVDFARRSLRQYYLRLLFKHPYTTESKDIDNHLWMVTSYQFISRYKDRLATLDRAIYGSPRQQQQQQQQRQQAGQQRVVEHRKLLQRFRQFLSEEEKFWRDFIVRIRRVFALHDAHRALTALNIVPEDETSITAGATGTQTENAMLRRSQRQFPPEADEELPAAVTATPTQRANKMAVLSKAFVHLGDIERYKEQYNEAGGRPRAGHEDGPPASAAQGRGGRGRRGGAGGGASAAPTANLIPRLRNYDKAQHCYEQARLLLPHEGNPSHGLAILAVYQKDVFGALVQYYRALCVRTPYVAAEENMQASLHKALEAWRHRGEEQDSTVPRFRVQALKDRLIVLHALVQPQARGDGLASSLPALSQKVVDDFKALVSERHLPLDMIWKVVILAQGALWRHRSTRRSSSSNRSSSKRAPPSASTESHIASHLLLLHRALLEVGIAQIDEAPEDTPDLAQRITAEFRRMLPALRLANKWLRANLRYILQAQAQTTANGAHADALDRAEGRGHRRDRSRRSVGASAPISSIHELWNTYAQFSTALVRTFPLEKLPTESLPFDEDLELTGFLPLRAALSSEGRVANTDRAPTSDAAALLREQVHPNEEQLMRIKDLLKDARILADAEETPLTFQDDKFALSSTSTRKYEISPSTLNGSYPQESPPTEAASSMPQLSQQEKLGGYTTFDIEDDRMTETSRTDDDPVGDAFRQALDLSDEADEEEQEDEIVWNPTAPLYDPPKPAPASLLPTRLDLPSPPAHISPRGIGPSISSCIQASADRTPAMSAKPMGTTAEDLLKGLQSNNPSYVPQSQLLFGAGPLGSPGSIWSTAHDGNNLKFQGAAAGTSSASYPLQTPYAMPQPSYSSKTSQRIPHHALDTMGLSQPDPFVNTSHQRASSWSLGRPQGLSSPSSNPSYNYYGTPSRPVEPISSPYSLGVPSAHEDPVYTTNAISTLQHYPPGHQAASTHHYRMPSTGQTATILQTPIASTSSLSQYWSNAR